MSKKLVTASKDATWAKLPRLSAISVVQAQMFDNRSTATGVKGQSDYALKLFVWTRQWDIDLKVKEWWRVVQLIDPKTVLSWATRKHAEGGMSGEQFDLYDMVATQAIANAATDDYEFVRMGHISSPPGSQYFVGQFVIVHKWADGGFDAIIIIDDGDSLAIAKDSWKPTRKAGRYRKAGTPTHAAIHDPLHILARQEEEKVKFAAMQTGGSSDG